MDLIPNFPSPPKTLVINSDAWSNGQISSKLWACEIVEKHLTPVEPLNLWVYGAWYGLLPVLFLTRNSIPLRAISLVDIDAEALAVARGFLENWICQKLPVSLLHTDCNTLSFAQTSSVNPDFVVNSSCEHFSSNQWLENIPSGTSILLQSTDMEHPTHINTSKNLSHFIERVSPWVDLSFTDERQFSYPDSTFSRFSLLGRRNRRL